MAKPDEKCDGTQSLPGIKGFKVLCRCVVTGRGGRDLEYGSSREVNAPFVRVGTPTTQKFN